MAELEQVILRIAVDIASKNPVEDIKTLSLPRIWAGGDTLIHVGVFNNGAIVDLNNVASVKASVKDTKSGNLPTDPSVAALFEDVVASGDPEFDAAVTAEQWTAETDQHVTFNFSAAQTAIAAGTYWIFFTATLTDGKTIPLGGGVIKVLEDGVGSTTVTEDTPVATLTESDLASQAEAEAGTDATAIMTALRTKQAIDKLANTLVSFPVAVDSVGSPGNFAFGDVSGVTWLSIYTGDGTTHSWAFSPFQTTYPS